MRYGAGQTIPEIPERQRPSIVARSTGTPIIAATVGMMLDVSTGSSRSWGAIPGLQNRIGTRRS
jgi:hypothetical protein